MQASLVSITAFSLHYSIHIFITCEPRRKAIQFEFCPAQQNTSWWEAESKPESPWAALGISSDGNARCKSYSRFLEPGHLCLSVLIDGAPLASTHEDICDRSPSATYARRMTIRTNEVTAIALRAVTILKARGLSSYLVGSAASALWGVNRDPNDVDLVVPTTIYTQEQLKQLLVDADSAFFTVASTNPRNYYRVLWCKPPGSAACKVDVLVPPVFGIPPVPPTRIIWRGGLPLAPLALHVLLKLQGWDDHRKATFRRPDLREKQYVDVADLGKLLVIARREGLDFAREGWLPAGLILMGKMRAASFVVIANPDSREAWADVGLRHEMAYLRGGGYF